MLANGNSTEEICCVTKLGRNKPFSFGQENLIQFFQLHFVKVVNHSQQILIRSTWAVQVNYWKITLFPESKFTQQWVTAALYTLCLCGQSAIVLRCAHTTG